MESIEHRLVPSLFCFKQKTAYEMLSGDWSSDVCSSDLSEPRIRHPQSGLGPGLRSRFFSNAPMAFHCLPQRLRPHLVSTTLGPSGGWFIRDKVMGRVPLLLGYTPQRADIEGGRVRLHLRAPDGTEREVVTE